MSHLHLMTSAEAASTLGVSTREVARRAATGALTPAVKLPGLRGAYLFNPDDVDAMRDDSPEASA